MDGERKSGQMGIQSPTIILDESMTATVALSDLQGLRQGVIRIAMP